MTVTRPLLSRTRDTTKKYLPEKDEETTERVPLWATHSALGVFFPLLPHPPFPQQKNKKQRRKSIKTSRVFFFSQH